MNGILVIDKPAGMTSRRAVDAVKRFLPRGTKVGHAGTLDSFATGVLLILIGKATKSCEKLMDQPKTYEATIKLGATTETDDPTTTEVPRPGRELVSREEIASALLKFVGAIQQRPPNFSALKIAGRRASDRVRAGETLDLQPRTIQIYKIDLLDFAYPELKLRVDCGRGTYIRSLARDLGEMLNTGGYLLELRRTKIGDFSIDNSTPLNGLDLDAITANLRAI